TSVERARDLRKRPVVILGAAEALRHAEIGTRDLLDLAARQSGPLAHARAGVTHADLDLAMIYDSYTITVLATLEALGFCAPGEGGAFCAGGRIGVGGALPVNPDGGGLSSNHPGMRGIFLVIEATRQLRGECGTKRFYPRALCPRCLSSATEWVRASGWGTVYSFTVTHQNQAPGFREELPYVLAIVELDEGVRMMTNVVGCAPDAVRIGMPVQVVFEDVTAEITLAKFRPA